jgi:3-hydroxyisobutyrate dehydrogenase-like beta-hydroxyacid dehydrogenase
MTVEPQDLSRADVGFAGVGRMGAPMALRLLEAGHGVRFYDPDPAAGTALAAAGGERVALPRELGAAPVSISIVPDGAALEQLLLGRDGICAGAGAEHLHVSMSTVGPRAVLELARRAADVALVDAPVSGSVALARAGTLTALVGADAEPYARALPLLRAMTRVQLHVGALGAGSAMKLAINAMVAQANEAIAEGLLLAEAHGIAPGLAYDAMQASVVASPYLDYKREVFLEPGLRVEGSVGMLRKDLELALKAAHAAGIELPGAACAGAVLQAAAAAGLREADVSAVVAALRTTAVDT